MKNPKTLGNEFITTLLKTIPFGMDIVDSQGNVLFMNDKIKAIVGKAREGAKCWELYRDDKKQCDLCPLIQGIKQGHTAFIETTGCFGGKAFQISHTGMIYKGKEAILEIFQDITERKKAEEAIREAAKTKSEFTSMVSHELRTPLAAIKEGISIVSDGTAGPLGAEQKEFLDMAKRNVDRLARLINDILDFQKLESGKVTFSFTENDINGIVKETGNTMAPLAAEKHLDISFESQGDLPKVKLDKDKIHQVLINLINNAIKFTDKGGVIITTARENDSVKIAVRDTGPGIAKEDMPKLFQQFTQLKTGIKRKTKGTGLGLAISKQIIEAHEGRIWAESEPGKGSVFYFTLPIK